MSAFSSIGDESPSFKPGNSAAIISLETSKLQEQSPETSSPTRVTVSVSESQDVEQGPQSVRDPLRWFGILVPPALRASQSSFKSAAINDVPSLASIMKEMNEVEIEIRRARKKLRKARRDTDPLQIH